MDMLNNKKETKVNLHILMMTVEVPAVLVAHKVVNIFSKLK